ncbi:hypothetical protein R6Q59_013937 [Mikania micrantha]
MEAPYYAPPQQHTGSSGLTIGFPLGTAGSYLKQSLCLLEAVSLSSKIEVIILDNKRDGDQSLPVIMAGDQLPRFIAMPCPCEPLRSKGKFVRDEIQMPPTPPHVVIPMD